MYNYIVRSRICTRRKKKKKKYGLYDIMLLLIGLLHAQKTEMGPRVKDLS